MLLPAGHELNDRAGLLASEDTLLDETVATCRDFRDGPQAEKTRREAL